MSRRSEQDEQIVFEGGPRHGQIETADYAPVVIGSGEEGGVYQRSDEERDGRAVYLWQVLTPAEQAALQSGDIRANQEPER